MVKNFLRSLFGKTIIVATCMTVLSIALITSPRTLPAQSEEAPGSLSIMRDGIVGTESMPGLSVSSSPFGLDLAPRGPNSRTKMGAVFNGVRMEFDLVGEVGKIPDPMELIQISYQLKEQYADNSGEDDILVDVTYEGNRTTTNITVNGNTFQVGSDNLTISKLYELMDLPPDISSAGGRVKAPLMINKVEPIYPETAKEFGISGNVILHVTTEADGTIIRVSAIEGHPLLKESAIVAVKQWQYEPAITSDGNPVAAIFGIIIHFLPDGSVKIPEPADVVEVSGY